MSIRRMICFNRYSILSYYSTILRWFFSLTPKHLNSQFLSWKQEENFSTHFVEPPHMQYTDLDDKFHAAKHPSPDHEEHGIKQNQCTLGRDGYQQCLIRNQILPQANHPLQMLEGRCLSLSNNSGLNTVHFDHKSPSLCSLVKKKRNLDHIYPISATINGENCNMYNDLKCVDSVLPKSANSSNNQPGQRSKGTELETEEPSLCCGDFKLFGKILSNPSHFPNSEETVIKSPSPKQVLSGVKSNLKIDRASILSQTETSSKRSGGGLPLRTYGFWDGKRIQTGLPSLPESAIFFSEYPRRLTDGKQPGMFSDLRKRNGVETMPAFQQQQGGVSLNMVGGGSSLVAASCTAVSDPVAAIRLHYTNVANQSAFLDKEESRRGDAGARS